MSLTWCNVYESTRGSRYICTALMEDSPSQCAYWASLPHNAEHWRAIYQFWNGTHLRPPVGMRADQASHEWLIQRRFQQPGLTADMCYTTVLELVPR